MSNKDKNKSGHFDFESLEFYIRSFMHEIGSTILEEILNSDRGKTLKGKEKGKFKDYREKKVLTVLGSIKINRAYYYDKDKKQGICPKDIGLNIQGTSFSPGIRRIMGKVGALRSFEMGHNDIKELAGISVTAKEIERISHKLGEEVEHFDNNWELLEANNIKPSPKMYISMDGTGVPVVKRETKGRKGKNGVPKTRESKLGCVFTQTTLDEKGHPLREEGSTSYVGSIETAEEFGNRIYTEARRRGVEKAEAVHVIGDGAEWIWNLANLHFYGANQILDIYHAREHYWEVAKTIFGTDKRKIKIWTDDRRKELNNGDVESVITAIEQLPARTEIEREAIRKEVGYFNKNKERMRYDKFRKAGLFIGSGVMEAGCRTVVGQRLKQAGMHWTVSGANKIIALRSCMLSNRWENFWEYRNEALQI